MSRRPRRTHSAAFKAKGALSAVRGDKTLAELAQQYDVHPNQITGWKNQLLAQATDVFSGNPSRAEPAAIDLKALHAEIGQLALENDFLEGALIKRLHAQRKVMIVRNHDLPIRHLAELVNNSRSSVYYRCKPVSNDDLKLMRRIDELQLELPFAGARMLRDLLRGEGVTMGRNHMSTLMRRMAISALYRNPNTDQGSQFTSAALTDLLGDHGIRIPMDGKGCWRDNVFIERLWRSIKYEEVYLQARTPDAVYFESLSRPSTEAVCPRRIHL